MNKEQSIESYVGDNIRKFRLAQGMTMEDMAVQIYKSKSTISKYEKGSIAVDIKTLGEIANALNLEPAQLLMMPASSKQGPTQGQFMEQEYMYSYDGKSKRIIKSVMEHYQTNSDNEYAIQLFYDVSNKEHLGDCTALYKGTGKHFDFLENYSLENSRHPIEQVWISCISGLSHNHVQVGFLAGLLNASLLPAVRKIVLSTELMREEELLPYLIFTKEDIKTIKKRNVFIINQFLE